MNNTITIVRSRNSSLIPDKSYLYNDISIDAIGLLSIMSAHSSERNFDVDKIKTLCADSRENIQRILDELRQAGYLDSSYSRIPKN